MIKVNIPLILRPSCWDKVDKVSSELETTFWLSVGSDWTGKISGNDGYCCVGCNSVFNPTGIGDSCGTGTDDETWMFDAGGVAKLPIKFNRF